MDVDVHGLLRPFVLLRGASVVRADALVHLDVSPWLQRIGHDRVGCGSSCRWLGRSRCDRRWSGLSWGSRLLALLSRLGFLDLFIFDLFDSRASLGHWFILAGGGCWLLCCCFLSLHHFFLLVLELDPALLESLALGWELFLVFFLILLEEAVDLEGQTRESELET